MAKDLTTSQIDRQNVLNNPYALQTIQDNLDIKFMNFNGTLLVTKQQTADFYGVDERTIERVLKANEQELTFNGYRIIQGDELKDFKSQFDGDINVGIKTVRLGVFDFRSFLNIGMLLTTSERARQLRAMILDVVIATITAIMQSLINGADYEEWVKVAILEGREKRLEIEKRFEE